MGLFKTKKSKGHAGDDDDNESSIPTKKKFPFLKPRKQPPQSPQRTTRPLPQQHDQANSTAIQEASKEIATRVKQQEHQQQIQQRDSHTGTIDNNEDEEEIGDIPRSISTPSRDGDQLLPPLPSTPKETNQDGDENGNTEDKDSIGSPCDAMIKSQQQRQAASAAAKNTNSTNNGITSELFNDSIQRAATIAKLQTITQHTPSLTHLAHYISALSSTISPDPSAELPSRALRCLFSLSEHSGHRQQRIDMVCNGAPAVKVDGKDENGKHASGEDETNSTSLIPSLLSFLQRTPRDSSEQYLTLLVLNNLSIPTANKRPIALQYGAAKTLGRLLCEDPGCHLLVIIVVNLTFGDEMLNRDLLTMSLGSVGSSRRKDVDGEENSSFGSCGGEVQLVDSLGYALLLASLTTEQLATLGPIPLTSPEGIHHTPRKLLSLLFSLLEDKLGIRYRRNSLSSPCGAASPDDGVAVMSDEELNAMPLSLGGDDCPFPETARWCLGALKNLTRPGKLSPSSIAIAGSGDVTLTDEAAGTTVDGTFNEEQATKDEQVTFTEELAFVNNKQDGSSVAADAILDAGILPLLLRILKCKEGNDDNTTSSICSAMYNWQSNSAQDAALYTVMHMASVPHVRRVLTEEYGCVEVLTSILNYGRVIDDKLVKNATADGGVKDDEDVELGYSSLQCLKARLALSYLVLGSSKINAPNNLSEKYGSATILADHETYTLVELLSNCLQGRLKDGPGGYSAATFTLKGVLYGIKCILSEPKNRHLFATTAKNGCRLNALLLKAVARYSLSKADLTTEVMDAEAAEHAVVSIYLMSMYGLDESVIGFTSPFGQSSVFLPATFGSKAQQQATNVVSKVLASYLNRGGGITRRGRHVANQILFRVDYLRFEGSVADLANSGTSFPSKSDLDLDDKVLAALKTTSGEEDEFQTKGAKPKEYIFNRALARRVGSKLFSSSEAGKTGSAGSKIFSSALLAAEELAWANTTGQHEKENTLDIIAVANNIAYYADGMDLYYGYTFKWEDGKGDLIERIYSAAETEDEMLLAPDTDVGTNDTTERSEPYSPPRKGFLGRLKMPIHGMSDDNEPFSIFGLRCGAPMCGKGHVL